MKAIISDKKEIAKGTLWLEYELEKEISFKPGQYFFISLKNPPYLDAEGNVRHFSIVNPPSQKGVIQMATRITQSAFKRSLKELPRGSEVDIHEIMGGFLLPKDASKQIVFIAGGIGITPFMSMLRHLEEQNPGYRITMFYFNRDKESTAFYSELQEMSKSIKDFKLVFIMTDDKEWKGESSKISSDLIKKYLADYQECYYMFAGPPGMVEAIKATLKDLRIKRKNMMTETFTGY